jgi:hypothetical protein
MGTCNLANTLQTVFIHPPTPQQIHHRLPGYSVRTPPCSVSKITGTIFIHPLFSATKIRVKLDLLRLWIPEWRVRGGGERRRWEAAVRGVNLHVPTLSSVFQWFRAHTHRPDTMTEVSSSVPECLQPNVGIILYNRPWPLPTTPVSIIHSLINLSFDPTRVWYDLLIATLQKQ